MARLSDKDQAFWFDFSPAPHLSNHLILLSQPAYHAASDLLLPSRADIKRDNQELRKGIDTVVLRQHEELEMVGDLQDEKAVAILDWRCVRDHETMPRREGMAI